MFGSREQEIMFFALVGFVKDRFEDGKSWTFVHISEDNELGVRVEFLQAIDIIKKMIREEMKERKPSKNIKDVFAQINFELDAIVRTIQLGNAKEALESARFRYRRKGATETIHGLIKIKESMEFSWEEIGTTQVEVDEMLRVSEAFDVIFENERTRPRGQ